MTVTVNLTIDDQTVALTIGDPSGPTATADDPTEFTVTPADPDVWDVTTSLQVPQPPPWEVHFEASADLDATGDTTVTSGEIVFDASGELRAVLPATWAEFEATYSTWADRNGKTWAQLTALET